MTISLRLPHADDWLLLKNVAEVRCAHLVSHFTEVRELKATREELEELREAASEEQNYSGFDTEYKPNERGVALERIIDLLFQE